MTKNFEVIDFRIQGHINSRDNNHSIRIYFDKELVFDTMDKKINFIKKQSYFDIKFSKICSFQKHELLILPINCHQFSLKQVNLNNLLINDFSFDIIEYKAESLKNSNIESHTFRFISPFAYYVLDRI